ncbi:MAG: DUF790 family protein [Sandaracinaceae bacterium]
MLTADHVLARRRDGQLHLTTWDARRRARALELATAYRSIAEAHLGRARDELLEAWAAVDVAPKDKKIADGLRKLVDDGLVFEAELPVDPVALRRAVFAAATASRRDLGDEGRFDREQVLREAGATFELAPGEVERALFADLRGAQRLAEVGGPSAEELVAGYDLEQARAVLLRAVRVRAQIRDAEPAAARALFRQLKFLRLLHEVERDGDGWRIGIDGPFSLFESVTKYGLQLALALPAISACGRWTLEADLRWGKERRPLRFRLGGDARRGGDVPVALPDEVEALRARFATRKGPWRAEVADEVLDLPGVGVCVPDLRFVHGPSGDEVLLEVLGYWSRDAVWKRVELAEAGLAARVLFAVSRRLRVSEAALDDEVPAALYVYKGAMSAKAVEERLEALRQRALPLLPDGGSARAR